MTEVARGGKPDWDSVIATWTSLQEAGWSGEPFAPQISHYWTGEGLRMKAILLVKGPRVGAGQSFGPLRSIAVAPLVADLLGVQPPRNATGVSPLAGAPLVARYPRIQPAPLNALTKPSGRFTISR